MDFSVDGSAVVPRRMVVDDQQLPAVPRAVLQGLLDPRQPAQPDRLLRDVSQPEQQRRVAAQDAIRRQVAAGAMVTSIDFKVMIHKIHRGENLEQQPYVIYGFGGTPECLLGRALPGRPARLPDLPRRHDLSDPAVPRHRARDTGGTPEPGRLAVWLSTAASGRFRPRARPVTTAVTRSRTPWSDGFRRHGGVPGLPRGGARVRGLEGARGVTEARGRGPAIRGRER